MLAPLRPAPTMLPSVLSMPLACTDNRLSAPSASAAPLPLLNAPPALSVKFCAPWITPNRLSTAPPTWRAALPAARMRPLWLPSCWLSMSISPPLAPVVAIWPLSLASLPALMSKPPLAMMEPLLPTLPVVLLNTSEAPLWIAPSFRSSCSTASVMSWPDVSAPPRPLCTVSALTLTSPLPAIRPVFWRSASDVMPVSPLPTLAMRPPALTIAPALSCMRLVLPDASITPALLFNLSPAAMDRSRPACTVPLLLSSAPSSWISTAPPAATPPPRLSKAAPCRLMPLTEPADVAICPALATLCACTLMSPAATIWPLLRMSALALPKSSAPALLIRPALSSCWRTASLNAPPLDSVPPLLTVAAVIASLPLPAISPSLTMAPAATTELSPPPALTMRPLWFWMAPVSRLSLLPALTASITPPWLSKVCAAWTVASRWPWIKPLLLSKSPFEAVRPTSRSANRLPPRLLISAALSARLAPEAAAVPIWPPSLPACSTAMWISPPAAIWPPLFNVAALSLKSSAAPLVTPPWLSSCLLTASARLSAAWTVPPLWFCMVCAATVNAPFAPMTPVFSRLPAAPMSVTPLPALTMRPWVLSISPARTCRAPVAPMASMAPDWLSRLPPASSAKPRTAWIWPLWLSTAPVAAMVARALETSLPSRLTMAPLLSARSPPAVNKPLPLSTLWTWRSASPPMTSWPA